VDVASNRVYLGGGKQVFAWPRRRPQTPSRSGRREQRGAKRFHTSLVDYHREQYLERLPLGPRSSPRGLCRQFACLSAASILIKEVLETLPLINVHSTLMRNAP